MPSAWAMRATFFGPTWAVNCAYTELSEKTVAFVRSIVPR